VDELASITGAWLQNASALTGVGMLMVEPDGPAGLIKQHLDSRAATARTAATEKAAAEREERAHRFAMEDRAAAAKSREEIKSGIAENTALTVESTRKAEIALDTANHTNSKIALIAEAALSLDRATERQSTLDIRHDIAVARQEAAGAVATDTNQTAHRIEDKL
jgi:hypothetical protein